MARHPEGPVSVRMESQAKAADLAMAMVIRGRLWQAGNIVRNRVLAKLSDGDKTGRIYRVPGTQRTYTASAPGEAPARRTGELARSYRTEPFHPMMIKNEILVGSELDYARWLEEGTEDMLARPHLMPAWTETQDAVNKILRRPTSEGEV